MEPSSTDAELNLWKNPVAVQGDPVPDPARDPDHHDHDLHDRGPDHDRDPVVAPNPGADHDPILLRIDPDRDHDQQGDHDPGHAHQKRKIATINPKMAIAAQGRDLARDQDHVIVRDLEAQKTMVIRKIEAIRLFTRKNCTAFPPPYFSVFFPKSQFLVNLAIKNSTNNTQYQDSIILF